LPLIVVRSLLHSLAELLANFRKVPYLLWKVCSTFSVHPSPALGVTDASPIFDTVSNLYGTTYGGGTYNDGAVYELTPQPGGDWTEKVLHSFNGKNGNDCYSGLLFDVAGNLFGTTRQGGAYDQGIVFELTPNTGLGWTEKVLHIFNNNGKDGAYPGSGLIFDAAGNLYGVASFGGAHNGGIVFEITP